MRARTCSCCLGGPVRFLLSNEKCKFFLDRLDIPADYKLNNFNPGGEE